MLWREHRGEALVLVVTAVSIVAVSMFEGVLIGLALAIAKTAWEASHVRLEVIDKGAGPVQAYLSGNATFLRLPKILDSLEALPQAPPGRAGPLRPAPPRSRLPHRAGELVGVAQ